MTPGEIDLYLTDLLAKAGWPLDGLLRLALAAFCGGLVGLEREVRGRQAGFRTNLLVCVGSALVMIVSIKVATHVWPSPQSENTAIHADPGRIAYGVMSGIGFIGAGTIIHNKGSVRGLTTAAALWCVAAIGLSAGMGLYLFTLLAALLVVVTLWVLQYVEAMIPQTRYRTLTIATPWSPACMRDVVDFLKTKGFHVVDTGFDRRDDPMRAIVTVDVAYRHHDDYFALERSLEHAPQFELMATQQKQL